LKDIFLEELIPCLILSSQVFMQQVASIETLRANAGIQGEVEISRAAQIQTEKQHGVVAP